MNKWLMGALCAAPLMVSTAVWAQTPQQTLSSRLDKVNAFSANFSQQVIGPDGKMLMQGQGDVEIQRPDLFRWNTISPDANVLVSDGTTLWYYNPFVEQVTAMWLKNATAQTPFVLLTQNNPHEWANYQVQQEGNTFTLTPKDKTATNGQFVITVNPAGTVKSFSTIEQDGQRSNFTLSGFDTKKPNPDLFTFKVPKGVAVDDQRN